MEVDVQAWTQILTNGLVIGLIYALLALGLALIFSIMGVVNLAHADFYMLGGILIYFLFGQFHINYFISLLIVTVVLSAIGLVTETIFLRRIRGQGMASAMILTLGLSFLIRGVTLIGFGEREKGIPSPVTGVIKIGSVSFGTERLLVMLISIAIIMALFYFVKYTKSGQAMRALAQDSEAAYLQGVDINKMSQLAFVLSAGLAGLGGGLIAPIFVVGYNIGANLILKLFIIVVLGGLGSLPGAVAGGFVIGFAEAISFSLFSGKESYLVIFTVMMLVFLIRPQGLLGKAEIEQ
jgi:branched-chain amino acid transport system permease protein